MLALFFHVFLVLCLFFMYFGCSPETDMGISHESMMNMCSNLCCGPLQIRSGSILRTMWPKQDVIVLFLTQQLRMLCFAGGKCSQLLPVLYFFFFLRINGRPEFLGFPYGYFPICTNIDLKNNNNKTPLHFREKKVPT